MGLLDAFKQYIADALPGGLLNPETKPVANQARYIGGLLDPNSPISQDAQNWHKRTQIGLADQLAGRQTPEAEQAYQTMMQAAGIAPVGMFIGKGAKTWDAVMMGKAQQMADAGADPRAIWKETGTWQGPDGHWRQEIPDTNAVPGHRLYSWGENADLQQGNGTVVRRQKALLHPALSAAYPETKNIAVSLRPGSKNGSFNEESKWMTVGADPKNFAADKSTTLHELQHAIQQREGFARGGSPEEFASGPMFDRKAQDLQFDLSKALTGGTFAGPKELADSIRFGEPSQLADIADKYGFRNIKEAMRFLEAEDIKRTPFGQYQRLAGEAEARATQARMNMDAAQRRATFPADSYDVPLDQLIIRK